MSVDGEIQMPHTGGGRRVDCGVVTRADGKDYYRPRVEVAASSSTQDVNIVGQDVGATPLSVSFPSAQPVLVSPPTDTTVAVFDELPSDYIGGLGYYPVMSVRTRAGQPETGRVKEVSFEIITRRGARCLFFVTHNPTLILPDSNETWQNVIADGVATTAEYATYVENTSGPTINSSPTLRGTIVASRFAASTGDIFKIKMFNDNSHTQLSTANRITLGIYTREALVVRGMMTIEF